jgi:Flp pilus assembly protein TadG
MAIRNQPAAPAGRRLRDQRGSVLVEFALTAVLFLTLIYGSLTYGVIFWVKATLTHAAGEGARASIRVDQAAAGSTAQTRAHSVLDQSLSTNSTYAGVTVTGPAACTGSSDTCLTVTVTYPYSAHPVIPPLPFLPGLPSQLQSVSVIQLP